MRAFMSTGRDHGGPFDTDGLLAGAAVREAERILRETEPREELDPALLAKTRASTLAWRAVTAIQHNAHAALAEALAAFVAE